MELVLNENITKSEIINFFPSLTKDYSVILVYLTTYLQAKGVDVRLIDLDIYHRDHKLNQILGDEVLSLRKSKKIFSSSYDFYQDLKSYGYTDSQLFDEIVIRHLEIKEKKISLGVDFLTVISDQININKFILELTYYYEEG